MLSFLTIIICLFINICLIFTTSLSSYEINNILLEKELFWIAAFVDFHKGLKTAHNWNRKRRPEKTKQYWK